MMTEPKKRGGQPKPDSVRKSRSLVFRVRADMRAALEGAARSNARSMSEEIEARLSASFDQPALIDALADRLEERQMARRAGLFTVLFHEDDASSTGTTN